ncbi:MAG: FAD-dependent oxidoreductase [Pseudomonadota bacterium]
MFKTYRAPEYAFRASEEQRSGTVRRHPVVVVGAGPVGLTAALDCARRGLPVVLVDDNNTVSVGSRAVCYAKRPLEIWDRLGVVAPLLERGVKWKVGKVFFRDDLVYSFDLLPEAHHKLPAMINLQQYHLEETLVAACEQAGVDLRWKHKVVGLAQQGDHVALQVDTPEGAFAMEAQWLIACDGANSDIRRMVGAPFEGQRFEDRFLIADVVMEAGFPPERWFWFDPPFHRGQSVLLHKQADNVWRIDFQLGRDADPEQEKKPEKVIPRIQAMLGPEAKFELEWVSVYQFACRRIDRFRYGRVLFAGDAAHQVSPFGARGANSGVQDTDNLVWKLKLVLDGAAPEALLDSYHDERAPAADDNIGHSTRSTDFITPKSRGSLRLRNAVLELAETEAFARPLVNSGRLSKPTPYEHSALNTPDDETFAGSMRPGMDAADAPVLRGGRPAWLIELLGDGFTLLVFGERPPVAAVQAGTVQARVLHVGSDVVDADGVLARRYDARPGTTLLLRPDQYLAARWRSFDPAKIEAALKRATCN